MPGKRLYNILPETVTVTLVGAVIPKSSPLLREPNLPLTDLLQKLTENRTQFNVMAEKG